MEKELVYICSPFRGNVDRNVDYAKRLVKWALKNGFTPIAPHLYIPQVLDDDVPEEREKGLNAGLDILTHCSTLIYGDRYGITAGMREEIRLARRLGIKVIAHNKCVW